MSGRERTRRSPDAAQGRWLPLDVARCRGGEVCSSPPSELNPHAGVECT